MASMRIEKLGKAETTNKDYGKKQNIIRIIFFGDDGKRVCGNFALKELLTALKSPRGNAVVVSEAYTFGPPV
jgi:hypothetical protein